MANIPLDTRFIGISPNVNLYERKTNLLNAQTQPYTMADFIAASGGAVTVTKEELDILVSESGLVPGAYYIIEGVDVNLYGGTKIIMQAATTSKLNLAGHGIFYNPKYINSQSTPNNGYGIWRNYITLSMSDISGTFYSGDTITGDNGATAIYLTYQLFKWVSGDWSLVTSIESGGGATANVEGGVSPSYSIGQDVIWGGKHWTNISGEVGTADSKYELSFADWEVVPFNDVDYNVVADVIHYDQEHDMIIRRKDKWDNDVDGNFQVFTEFSSVDGYDYGNPIKDFQWGNGSEDFNTDDYSYVGVQSNYVKDSYLDCINFIGIYLWNNTLIESSYFYNNICNTSCYFYGNTLNNSNISNNVLSNDSHIYDNILTNSNIEDNQMSNSSRINNNTFISESSINNNTLITNTNIASNVLFIYSDIALNIISNNSFISGNMLNNNGAILNNTISSSSFINNNELKNSSTINENTLNNTSRIELNSLNIALINTNQLSGNCIIRNNTLSLSDNTFTNNSQIVSNILNTSSYIDNNTLIIGSIKNNNLDGGYLRYNTVNYSKIEENVIYLSLIYNNNLYEISSIVNNSIIEYSFIDSNTLTNSTFDFSSSGELSGKLISNIDAKYANAVFNISASTIIYGNYSKQMFRNSAGTTRLGYYNASDVFTVVNVNA